MCENILIKALRQVAYANSPTVLELTAELIVELFHRRIILLQISEIL